MKLLVIAMSVSVAILASLALTSALQKVLVGLSTRTATRRSRRRTSIWLALLLARWVAVAFALAIPIPTRWTRVAALGMLFIVRAATFSVLFLFALTTPFAGSRATAALRRAATTAPRISPVVSWTRPARKQQILPNALGSTLNQSDNFSSVRREAYDWKSTGAAIRKRAPTLSRYAPVARWWSVQESLKEFSDLTGHRNQQPPQWKCIRKWVRYISNSCKFGTGLWKYASFKIMFHSTQRCRHTWCCRRERRSPWRLVGARSSYVSPPLLRVRGLLKAQRQQ